MLLHITSQPAEQSIASNARMAICVLGAVSVAVPVVAKIYSRWSTHIQAAQCAKMQSGANKDQAVFDLVSSPSFCDRLFNRRDDQKYAVQIAHKKGLDIDLRGKNGWNALRLDG